MNQLCQPCKDLNDPNDKEAIRAVLPLRSLNPSCWQKVANSQVISQSVCIDHTKSLDIVFPITKAIAFVPGSKTVSLCAYSPSRLFWFFFPADSQYKSQFDYKQTEVDYLITSEEVTKKNSESSINDPYIRIQQNSLCQPDNTFFTMRKRKLVTLFFMGALTSWCKSWRWNTILLWNSHVSCAPWCSPFL